MIKTLTATAALLAVLSAPAEARHRHHAARAFSESVQVVDHPPGCPRRAFCGCGVSVKVFGRPIRDLFLASNWRRFARAFAGPGMVAVRNHHVMYIISTDGSGNALVYDPNSGGHQTRIHYRSLAGYEIRNPNG